jgi:hypothetical protein
MGFARLQRASAKRGLSGRSDADAGDRCGPIFDGAVELTRENDEIGRRRFASPSAAQLLETIAQTFALEELDEVNSPPAATRRSSGCFCERLKDGGSVQHLQVVYAAPGEGLRLRGALGPLQTEGVDGTLSWTLKPVEGGTSLTQSYVVGGYIRSGMEQWGMKRPRKPRN